LKNHYSLYFINVDIFCFIEKYKTSFELVF